MTTYKNKYRIPDGYSTTRLIIRSLLFLRRNSVRAISLNMDKFGDAYSAIFPGDKLIIVTQDLGFIQHVLRDNHTNYRKSEFTTAKVGRLFGKGLLFSNGDYWLRQRRLIQPGFHTRKLQELYKLMTETIEGAMAEWPTGNEIDVYPLIYQLAFDVILRSLFDIDLKPAKKKEMSLLFNQMQDFVVKDVNRPLRQLFYRITRQDKINLKRSERMRDIIREIIRQRRQDKREYADLLDMLLSARYEDTGEAMSEDQIIDEVLVLLLAGHETTANTLSWMLSLLADQPAVTDRLKAIAESTHIYDSVRNDYINAVINEAMRLRPAAFMTDRVAITDDHYGPWTFPKGTVVLSFFYGLHRHEDHWQHADIFLPERWLDDAGKLRKMFAFFPFGAGPRLCIGNNFAMAEMCFFTHAFFRRYNISSTGHVPNMLPLITLRPDKIFISMSPV
ncbi:MAG: cytochrome P450 [Chitinophagaceae bacterium]|nr:cytochrome P450 [Chitinophagaceae bacterium]